MEHETTPLERWINFLANEKLSARIGATWESHVFPVAEALANSGVVPRYTPYKQRLESRAILCRKAMDMGIDLAGIKHHGKIAMGRGLLDAWQKEYAERFGSNIGTAGWKETTRRNIKSRKPGKEG